ncbi:HIT family protein [Cohnella nanjingensis]|nr:HIT family protein [Cohnella nanjingensis]
MQVDREQEAADCFICRKHRGDIQVHGGTIYEDDLLYVGHISSNEKQAYLGYLIIDVKRHTPGLAELTEREAQSVGSMLTRVSRALKACEKAVHIYAAALGDHVPHFHIHVIPRYSNTPPSFWGLQVREWEGAPRGGQNQIEQVCSRIRAYLREDKG